MSPNAPSPVLPTRPGLHVLLDEPTNDPAHLTQRLAHDAIQRDVATIVILLDHAAPQFRQGLTRHGTNVEQAENKNLIQYVDAHAPRVGWAHTTPATVFAEEPDHDALLLALNEAQTHLIENEPQHQVLISTLSSLLVLEGLHATYEFCQTLASMAPRMGTITLAHAIPQMHDEKETTALHHLATTVTDLRDTTSHPIKAPPQRRTEDAR